MKIYNKFKENNKNYRLSCDPGELALNLHILEENSDNFSVFESIISKQTLQIQANQLGLKLCEFYEEIVKILENLQSFSVKINSESFTIFKSASNSNIKVKFLTCELTKIEPVQFLGNFIDEFVERNVELTQSSASLKCELKVLKGKLKAYEDKLDELVVRKNNDEKSMLCNFVSVLNEKKRKIQHLNESLEVYRENPRLANPTDVNTSYKKKKINSRNIKEEISESENSGYNTSDTEENVGEIVNNIGIKQSDDFYEEILDISPGIQTTPPSETHTKYHNSELPSCSKNVKNPAENSTEIQEKLYEFTDINTQDWIDNL